MNDRTADIQITAQFLRAHQECVFVFGDNLLRKGKKGAATLRDEPNAYGFITKKAPSYDDNAYYRPAEYEGTFRSEMRKLTSLVEKSPDKTFLLTPLGSGLANRYHIYELIIKPALAEMARRYNNILLLAEKPAAKTTMGGTPQIATKHDQGGTP